jgi:hypothetical protein
VRRRLLLERIVGRRGEGWESEEVSLMRESWKPQRGSKLHLVGELARCLIPDNFKLPAGRIALFSPF